MFCTLTAFELIETSRSMIVTLRLKFSLLISQLFYCVSASYHRLYTNQYTVETVFKTLLKGKRFLPTLIGNWWQDLIDYTTTCIRNNDLVNWTFNCVLYLHHQCITYFNITNYFKCAYCKCAINYQLEC